MKDHIVLINIQRDMVITLSRINVTFLFLFIEVSTTKTILDNLLHPSIQSRILYFIREDHPKKPNKCYKGMTEGCPMHVSAAGPFTRTRKFRRLLPDVRHRVLLIGQHHEHKKLSGITGAPCQNQANQRFR